MGRKEKNKGMIFAFFCAILLLFQLETAEAQEVTNTKVQMATLSTLSAKVERVNNPDEGKGLPLSKEIEERLRRDYGLEPPEPVKPKFTSDWGIIYGDIMMSSGKPALQLGPNASRDLAKLFTYIITIANL
ncbi:hypothetical protein J45TS6_41090 [Paenibacillus sp. J45TS6]|uniref:hypothetical protein n=1 Tax=Paenibacillus sp. J45TS6 TaxID=2807196 RepID=UPI001B22CCEC|nr:hypothetical protein [Paenibacillus sp. J45TS6]GIP45650.1 hypothetical protein J45TS6_41090 [Paenibacillus sp. J45TS6]